MKFNFVLIIVISALLVSCSEKESGSTPTYINDYSQCVIKGKSSKLEIATLNLENFPKEYARTLPYVSDLVLQMDVDIIALQEISSNYWLQRLVDNLPGWKGVFSPSISGTQSLAYLYKTSEIELLSLEALYTSDSYAFPRPPLKAKFKYKSTGTSTYVINLHLKCCGDGVERRKSAAVKLKDYVDTNLGNEKVIVLGDYNDVIDLSRSQVFSVLTNDAANYKFVDMAIAKGDRANWSYPSYPSHIDHILVTNEWFSSFETAYTLKPELCIALFENIATDHRPVVAVFNP
jgi:endonuclease/exonuclease/phosphatase family metal-dependent hydrolase